MQVRSNQTFSRITAETKETPTIYLTLPKPDLTIQELILKATLAVAIIASAPVLIAQEMEPRAYSNVPIGMNFAVTFGEKFSWPVEYLS